MRRTEDEAAQTRNTILVAALEEFAREGWNGSSLVAIAKRARLSRGAIYHHFIGKEDLLSAVLSEQWQSQMRPITAALAQMEIEPQQRLQNFLETYIWQLSEQERFRQLAVVSTIVAPQVLDVGVNVERKNEVMQCWSDLLKPILSQGITLEVDQALFTVMTFIHGVTIMAATEPQKLPSKDDIAIICQAVTAGLFPQSKGSLQ